MPSNISTQKEIDEQNKRTDKAELKRIKNTIYCGD